MSSRNHRWSMHFPKQWGLCLFFAVLSWGCRSEGTRAVGEACLEKGDCASGFCLHEYQFGEQTGWKDGYCSTECDLSCYSGASCVIVGEQAFCMADCDEDDDCRSGYLCNPWYEVCLPDCRGGLGCGDDLECSDDGYCIVPGEPPPESSDIPSKNQSKAGGPCRLSTDCRSDLCLAQIDTEYGVAWKDGMCTEFCGKCDDGFYCATLGDYNYCMPDCRRDSDCRDGYICEPTLRVCFPDCREGFDCGSLQCDEGSGACFDKDPEESTTDIPSKKSYPLGSPCRMVSDCDSEYCIPQVETESGIAWKEGMCSSLCGTCEDGFYCASFGEFNVCVPTCEETEDCRDGYVCSPSLRICVPDCRIGFECDPYVCGSSGSCEAVSSVQQD